MNRSEKKRIWRHRLRGHENVSVSIVTRKGKPFVQVVVDAALPEPGASPSEKTFCEDRAANFASPPRDE